MTDHRSDDRASPTAGSDGTAPDGTAPLADGGTAAGRTRRESPGGLTDDGVADDGTWRPTRTSMAAVVLLTVPLAVVLAARAGPLLAVAIGAADAVLFAASLWLVTRDRFRVVTSVIAGVLALFVGGGFAVAIGYAALSLLGDLFPVEQAVLIGPRGLQVVSSTAVIVGSIFAILGALTAVGNVLRRETVEEYGSLSTRALVLPGLLTLVAIASAVLSNLGGEGEGGPVSAIESLLGDVVGAFTAPVPGQVHLFTFSLVVAVTAASLARALSVLPVAELATGEGDSDPEATVTWLRHAAIVATVAALFGLVEFLLPPETVARLLTPPVYDVLAALTGSALLRRLLVGLALVSAATLGVVRALRRLARTTAREALVGLAPVAAGGVVVGGVALVHRPLLAVMIGFVTDNLPGVFAEMFAAQSAAIVTYYGSFTVALSFATVLLVTTAATAGWLTIAMRLGYLPDETAAPALARGGLFVAAVFGGASGFAMPLVVTAVVASFLVWDVGEFGITLGREIGREARTRGTELVHFGASLAVGVLEALAMVVVLNVATRQTVAELTTAPFAVVAVVVALLLLFAALR
ncbi:MAG: hypothetical protein ABEJ85_04175 [Haloarculaceae archaeon]